MLQVSTTSCAADMRWQMQYLLLAPLLLLEQSCTSQVRRQQLAPRVVQLRLRRCLCAPGPPWVSMLVRTGVFNSPDSNDAEHPAAVVVEDVHEAVKAGLHRARSHKWHSMR